MRPCLIHTCHAMPMLCSDHAVLLKATAQHVRRNTACGLPARVRTLPATTQSSTKVVIRRIPVSDADGQCETKHRLIFEVPFITLNSEMIPTRCNNCVYSSQWLYSTCFGWQFYPSSGVQCCMAFQVGRYTYVVILSIFWLSYLCRSCWVVGNTVLLCRVVSLNAECWVSPETCRVKPLRRINAIIASCWNYFTIL